MRLEELGRDGEDIADGRLPGAAPAVGDVDEVDLVAVGEEVVGPTGPAVGLGEPVLLFAVSVEVERFSCSTYGTSACSSVDEDDGIWLQDFF